MTSPSPSSLPGLDDARTALAAAEALVARCLERARVVTENGERIDAHQVLGDRVAYAATEARAARELVESVAALRSEGRADAQLEALAAASAADLALSIRNRLEPALDDLGLGDDVLEAAYPVALRRALRRTAHESVFRALGRRIAETRGRNETPLDEISEQVRSAVREFAEKEVAPHAERIHRHDELVPEEFITKMSELGYFAMSVPEEYGGQEFGNLAMILTTEELSRASLAAAGSLITRPEILTKALIQGGTEAQKKHWLPKIAAGELMVGISVTEPDVGSDVASLKCRADRATVGGRDGFVINGPKSWCTFAGRANVLALLARTDPDASKGAKGLSLFIVEKDTFDGHSFEMKQPEGGRMVGKADATPGYRGMHSFTLMLEDYFVPAENLVGGEAGLGKGFYLQMAGFAAGRLQTGGRACGLAQAALEKTAEYVVDRVQFKKPISEYGLTQFKLGRMAARLAAARAITYAAARAMDEDERKAAPLAAQAKLFACDIAVEVTQEGQLLHGGWGYAEEYPISRYVVDATVLPIFEGVKPILSLKVVARNLLG
ncbi:MAG TPA: acyl-CoA dehydrogenase family protein [Myxococcota bacterium]|jgi:(2S)-methylsuccinyl-CoA dehydrogenase|nr:acyl-CoA dehydrogenase family protein [Myxococcota bacterium]